MGEITRTKPLFVGELNPYGSREEYALYPDPRGCSGERLQRLVMGVTEDAYLERFDRANLCQGKWSLPVARMRAADLVRRDDTVLVLLGAKVCAAFGVEYQPSTTRPFYVAAPDREGGRGYDHRLVVLGHPSGLNRHWHAPGAFDAARAVLRQAGVLPTCVYCWDTHQMWHSDLERYVMCTGCPTPCPACRQPGGGGGGPYCAVTPCACGCHTR